MVNCGSDQFWGPSYGTDNIGTKYGYNFFVDFLNPLTPPVGCVTYNSPGKIIAQ